LDQLVGVAQLKLHHLVGVSRSVAATRSRNAKRDALAEAIRAMVPDERAVGVAYLSGALPQGRVGVGPAALQDSAKVPASALPTVSVTEVDEAIERVRNAAGPGSAAVKRDTLRGLFGRCVPEEQLFLVRLLVGEVRQGALDGVMVEAIALASGCSAAYVRHAHMLQGNLPRVADVAMTAGEPGLRRIRLSVGTPVQSMLAQTATEVGEAVAAMPSALLDTKMDGARVQVHKSGSDVAVFSRQHNDVSASVPEVVEAVAAMPASDLVLDGEVVAFDGNGRPLPFQTTMRRFGRRQNVAALRRASRHVRPRRAAHAADADGRFHCRARLPPGGPRCGARGRDGEGPRVRLRGGQPRQGLAQGQAGAHSRPRRAGGGVGARPSPGLA